MILNEFDENKKAIINPEDWIKDEISVKGEIPKIAVSCFEGKTFERLVKILGGEVIAVTRNANEEFPIYKVKYKDKEIALYMADMGAAGAGGQLEEIIALGVEKFIIFGSCGVLDENIEDCSIIIPNSAVRDEGLKFKFMKERSVCYEVSIDSWRWRCRKNDRRSGIDENNKFKIISQPYDYRTRFRNI